MSDASDTLSALNGDMSTPLDKATKPKPATGGGGYLSDMKEAANLKRENADKNLADVKAEAARYNKEIDTLGPPPALHVEKWTQKPPENDPVKSFGSWASAVGVLGSLLTRRPLASALNASAAAMNAYRQNDLAAYKDAKDAWKENTELAMKQSEYELKVYDDIYKRAGLSHNERMAEISAAAAANDDKAMAYMLDAKGEQGYQEMMQSRQNMAKTAQEMSHNAGVYAEEKLKTLQDHATDKAYIEGKMQEWAKENPGVKVNPQDPRVQQKLLEWGHDARMTREAKDIATLAGAKGEGSEALYQSPDGRMYRVSKAGNVQRKDGDTWVNEQNLPTDAKKLGSATPKTEALTTEAMQTQYDIFKTTGRAPTFGYGQAGQAARVAYMNALPAMMKKDGFTAEEIATKQAEFQGEKAAMRTLGNRETNIFIAAAEADRLAPVALAASEAVSRSGIHDLNILEQKIQRGTASEDMRRFDMANTALVTAYSQVMSRGGVPTDASREHANSILGTAFSKGDYGAAVDQLKTEISAAEKAPGDIRQMFEKEWGGKTGGEPGKTETPKYSVGQIVDHGGKKYRVTGGDMNDPDVEPVQP